MYLDDGISRYSTAVAARQVSNFIHESLKTLVVSFRKKNATGTHPHLAHGWATHGLWQRTWSESLLIG